MDKQQLRDRFEELHKELKQINSVDEDERKILKKMIGDINKLIEADDTDQHQAYDRLGEGLREGVERFEASHPRATMLMGQLADALAKIGI